MSHYPAPTPAPARIAIDMFLKRFPNYRLSGPTVRGGRARFRGFLSIPVAVG